jgi:hypothetical protein
LVERFERFLPSTGEVTLTGPDPTRLPVAVDGAYKLLLRIEASDDKEGTSNTGGGRLAIAGGVAGFPMPVLRYVVGGLEGAIAGDDDTATRNAPVLLGPAPDAAVADKPLAEFAWTDPVGAVLMRLELQSLAESRGAEVLSALVRPGVGRYAVPPWFVDAQRGKPLRWRVLALDGEGRALSRSGWRGVSFP